MGPRQHRGRRVGVRRRGQPGEQPVDGRQQHGVAGGLQHERVGEVVDVLGGTREVHEAELGDACAGREQPAADVVLDRLDVVRDARFLGFDRGRLVRPRRGGERFRGAPRCVRQLRELGQAQVRGEVQEPQRLDTHAVPDQRRLAEQCAQLGALAGIAAVDRGERVECARKACGAASGGHGDVRRC
jgi:hypothetical protein